MAIEEDILNQLYARFLLNIPSEAKEIMKTKPVRILFELEKAHWFYLDNFCTANKNTTYANMYEFSKQMCQLYPSIIPPNFTFEEIYDSFKSYKATTPTYGAIILDETRKMVLLVQGFSHERWSFPGGKVNEAESSTDCAVREVLEETGLDIRPYIDRHLYIEHKHMDTIERRQFIIEGFSRLTPMNPTTRNEIRAITWFHMDDFPSEKSDVTHLKNNQPIKNFFLVLPHIRQLKIYIDYRERGFPPHDALAESEREVRGEKPKRRTRQNSEKTRCEASRNSERENFRMKNKAMMKDLLSDMLPQKPQQNTSSNQHLESRSPVCAPRATPTKASSREKKEEGGRKGPRTPGTVAGAHGQATEERLVQGAAAAARRSPATKSKAPQKQPPKTTSTKAALDVPLLILDWKSKSGQNSDNEWANLFPSVRINRDAFMAELMNF